LFFREEASLLVSGLLGRLGMEGRSKLVEVIKE
jgi:hypothetical protein